MQPKSENNDQSAAICNLQMGFSYRKKNSRSMADKLETIRHYPGDFNKFFENKEEKNTIP